MFGQQISPQQVSMAINNAVITTAMLANEFCIQTQGQAILAESDYPAIVTNFNIMLSKKIMPPKTQAELKAVTREYVADLISKMTPKESADDNGNEGQTEDSRGDQSASTSTNNSEDC